jgi:Tfp pilus assembly protein PilZ
MPVDVREGPGIYSPALTLNVSRRGLLLETSRDLQVGSQLEIITPLTQNDRKIVVPARVVRLEKKSSGEYHRLGLELLSGEADNRDWEDFLTA